MVVVSNVLILIGLVCIAVATAALAGLWWGLLVLGLLLVGAGVAHGLVAATTGPVEAPSGGDS